jgi:hypothetical protein
MDFSSLTDLEILTAAERHDIELLSPTQRFNCIRKIKRIQERSVVVENVNRRLEWFERFKSKYFKIDILNSSFKLENGFNITTIYY